MVITCKDLRKWQNVYLNLSIFTVFLKNKNIIFKIRRSKVTEYAALNGTFLYFKMCAHLGTYFSHYNFTLFIHSKYIAIFFILYLLFYVMMLLFYLYICNYVTYRGPQGRIAY